MDEIEIYMCRACGSVDFGDLDSLTEHQTMCPKTGDDFKARAKAWIAGRDYGAALSRDRAPGEDVIAAAERIIGAQEVRYKVLGITVIAAAPEDVLLVAREALAARPEGA